MDMGSGKVYKKGALWAGWLLWDIGGQSNDQAEPVSRIKATGRLRPMEVHVCHLAYWQITSPFSPRTQMLIILKLSYAFPVCAYCMASICQ